MSPPGSPPEGLGELLAVVCADAEVRPLVSELPAGVEVARRSKDGTDWTFCINHGARDVRLPLEGVDLLTGTELKGGLDGGLSLQPEPWPSSAHRPPNGSALPPPRQTTPPDLSVPTFKDPPC